MPETLFLSSMNATTPVRLAPRHLRALELAAQGLTEDEAARRAGKSPHTMHGYFREARERLKAPNNVRAVALVVAWGLVQVA